MTSQTIFLDPGATDVTVDVSLIQDSSGANPGDPITGLLFNSASLVCYYRRGGTGALTQLTLATQTVTGAHSDGGFVEISSANAPGQYRLDLSDAITASGVDDVTITLSGFVDLSPHTIHVIQSISTTTEIRDAVTGGAYPLDTDSNGRVRVVDGTGAGEIDTNTGRVEANVVLVSGDSGAADNLQLMYDGTGYTDSTAPASRAQIAALNDITASQVRTEMDSNSTQLAKLGVPVSSVSADIAALNDVAATDIVSNGAITTLSGAVVNVDTVDVTTANTDMRGTDGANTVAPDNATITSIKTDTGTTIPALLRDTPIQKNQAFSNFTFPMVLTSDHVSPGIGLTVTGQRSVDGGSFTAVSGVITEISNGFYKFDPLAADTNGDIVTWRFSAATADDTAVTFTTIT